MEKESELVKAVRALPKGSVYVRHMYNPDWARLGLEVNLVNMVRDPISLEDGFLVLRHQVKFTFRR